jgi:hypothetical protein
MEEAWTSKTLIFYRNTHYTASQFKIVQLESYLFCSPRTGALLWYGNGGEAVVM